MSETDDLSPTASPAPAKRGRPAFQFDDARSLADIEWAGQIGATYAEIAMRFGCCEKTVQRRMNETLDDGSPGPYRDAYERGKAALCMSLRRAQLHKAGLLNENDEKDTGMLIWLGKQLLGQKQVVTHEGGDKPIGVDPTSITDLELARRIAMVLAAADAQGQADDQDSATDSPE